MRAKQAGQEGQRFQIVRALGSGGFGAVYEAFDHVSKQTVALKELTRVSPSALFRFKQEFRALADIHHPNLVQLKELIEQDGHWYIAMELIHGSELLSFVRQSDNDPGFDEARLRAAFIGVAEGLEALHGYGVLHRDLKPSNVLVTPEGRAVLLDFGLVTSLDALGQSTHAAALGTVLYMAPEQAEGQKLGRATDWYAFGASLYEALTGRPPFEGESALHIILDKLRNLPAPPSTLLPNLPEDLSALCTCLLQIAPQSRPKGREVLQVLRGEALRESLPSPPLNSLPPARLFTGREPELAQLERALSRTHAGELRIVLVEGESGVGKSELVAEFLRHQQQLDPRTIALRGRCYENEQVSYKAFDGCIDELARVLRRMGKDAAALMPVQAPLLAQLFPVLADVQTLSQARSGNVAADPSARRLQAFAALAALLGNLAEEQPLIVVVDDLQWADSESFRLLRALVEDQARPPILLLASVRPREELDKAALADLEQVREWTCTDVVSLYGLPQPQAEALAEALLGADAQAGWARTIALESRGHPLFLAELIRFTQSQELARVGQLTLDAALAARVERLGKEARSVLEVVALAARPHAPALFARALELPGIEEHISTLLGQKLLRRRREQEVGCYHDRIRRAVVELIPSTRLPHLHRRLALAISDEAALDPREEATHWDLAGEPDRALEAYERAAKQAFESLAFTQAERLLARALELAHGPEHARYASLTRDRAHALACAGRSTEAAALYQRAAALATDEEQRLRLRSRTALQLMLSGNVQAGLEACRDLFLSLGLRMPRSDWGAILLALWNRVRTRFPKPEALAERRVSARTRLVLDLAEEHLPVLPALRTAGFLALNSQYMRIALALGDRMHAIGSLSAEGWLRNARRGIASAEPLFETARKLCALEPDNVRLRARLIMLEGSARLASSQWAQGTALLSEAHELLQAHFPDDPWLLTDVRHQLGMGWFRMGEHAHLARMMDAWILQARERQDRLALALLTGQGHGSVRHVMRGDLDAALAELEESVAPIPRDPFSFVHMGHMQCRQLALTLQGGRTAWDWLERERERHQSAFLLKTRFGKTLLRMLRAQSALRALEVTTASERPVLLKSIQRNARSLTRERSSFAQSCASHLSAQLAALEGNAEAALQLARKARLGFESIGSAAARGARYLEGLLEGGESGATRCHDVLAFYQNQGWRQPELAVLALLPTLPLLRQPTRRAAPSSQRVQHYEVLARLGSGGFGSVVEARDTRSSEHVALKQLVSASGHSLERFKREFRALRDLHHPNVVRFHALFEHEQRWYISMELVRGQNLISYVRPGGKLDATRLRSAFSGLLAATRAVHDAGLVHRDLSADNVHVTGEGRAVLLDFGLVAREHNGADADAVGSAIYAAPEQLEGVPPHRSADAYALGVCLYQALTGSLPFDSASAHALTLKRTHAPPAPQLPTELAPLGALCMRLLSPLPAARPALHELERLLTTAAERPATQAKPHLQALEDAREGAAFAGRSTELAALQAAWLRARAQLTLALVQGESGMGKSALVAAFTEVLETETPQLWCLRGRCYENEQLSLKAFDGIVDQLAHKLRGMPVLDCEELLPKKAAILAQLFPVLGSVPAIADAPKKGLPADPMARRSLALALLAELLERIAQLRPLLLVIDDLQWADAESFALLHALSQRARALPLLVVATVRPAHELPEALSGPLESLKGSPDTRLLALGSLTDAEARALASTLLGMDVPDEVLARLAHESQGHPLFLRELVQRAKAHGVTISQSRFSLDEALAERITRFEFTTRDLLALVALAGKPYPSHLFAAAFDDPDMLYRGPAQELLNQGLLRRRGDTALACYHDRVRQVAIALLAPAQRTAYSERLARALDAHAPDEAPVRARLWDEAGQPERALAAHEQAGDAALEKLAFAQAAAHFARALELAGRERDERWRRLTVQHAHALVRLGRNAEAAALYAAAALGAPYEQEVRLRILAAQNLIQGAQVEEGLSAARQILGELQVSWPASERKAVGRIAVESVRLRMRGLTLRNPKRSTSAQKLALEALSELSQPVASAAFLHGSALSAQHMRRALDSGDPAHAARALAYEGILRSARKPGQDHSLLFAKARELARASDDPAVIASVEARHGIASMARSDFRSARASLSAAHELVASQCAGQAWLLTTIRVNLGMARYYSGHDAELARDAEQWVGEAKERGDRYGYAALVSQGCGYLRHLMRDDVEAARQELEEAMRPWPSEPFSTNHYGELQAYAETHLQGGGDGTLHYLEQQQGRIEKAALLKNPIFQLGLRGFRFAASVVRLPFVDQAQAVALLRGAERDVEAIRRIGSRQCVAYADLYGAVLEALAGRRDRALSLVRLARTVLTELEFRASSRASYLEGWLEGGADGALKCEQAIHGAVRQGWKNPNYAWLRPEPLAKPRSPPAP